MLRVAHLIVICGWNVASADKSLFLCAQLWLTAGDYSSIDATQVWQFNGSASWTLLPTQVIACLLPSIAALIGSNPCLIGVTVCEGLMFLLLLERATL